MPVIKRYPNRKLYNTETKEYISLDGIGELIRDGAEIQVLDHATGADLTAVTLSQIIAEREKKERGFLPGSVLAGLIQTGGSRLTALQHTLFNAVDFLPQVNNEIERRINILVKQGEMEEDEGDILLEKLLSIDPITHSPSTIRIEDEIERILYERKIPSRQDMEQIMSQLEDLSMALERLGSGDQ